MYKIKDIGEADFGRREIEMAEVEMPGLMSIRAEHAQAQPLKGLKIMGSLHMTIQTAVLMETLKSLGADVRWCSCNIFSTQNHAAAAMAQAGLAIFAWKGMTEEEYWWCTEQALTWPDGSGPDQIVDDGCDATMLIHEGVRLEAEYAAKGTLPDPTAATSEGEREMLALLKRSIEADPQKWTRVAAKVQGVSEETTTGVHRLQQLAKTGELLFPAINVNDCVTKSKFDNNYGCKHSLPDALMRATDVMLAGKTVVVCGYGDVGKGCAAAMRGCGSRVVVTEIDPICALQAAMEGFKVSPLEKVAEIGDIFVTTTGNCDIIRVEHMRQMKNNAIVCNIGHFDNEIDVAGLLAVPNLKHTEIKPQVDRYVFPDTGRAILLLAQGRLCNLGCATGHPSFVMSCSFSNQVEAQIELKRSSGNYQKQVYLLPKLLDEKVARHHLAALGAELTQLTPKQSGYINVPCEGPFKPETYRY